MQSQQSITEEGTSVIKNKIATSAVKISTFHIHVCQFQVGYQSRR